MGAYLKREEERVSYVEVRMKVRTEEKEKADIQAALEESQRERLAAAEQEGVDLEAQRRQQENKKLEAEERAYQSLEAQFVTELGITEEYLREARSDDLDKSQVAELVRGGLVRCGSDQVLAHVRCPDVSLRCDVLRPILQGDTIDLDDVGIDLGATGVSFQSPVASR